MKSFLTLAILIVGIASSGCASYRAVSLPFLQSEFCPTAQTISGITTCTKALSQDDCRKYFDKNLIREGIQPIQITIHNDTKRYLLLKKDSISLPLVPPEEVAAKAHRNTAGRATAYGVAGIIIWPLLIPAIVDGVGSSNANQQMDNDFAAKGIDDTLIQPYSKINGVVFTSTDGFDGSFTLTLLDREESSPFLFSWPEPTAGLAQRQPKH